MNEIYLIEHCTSHQRHVRGYFYETLDAANKSIDRLFELETARQPKYIERKDSRVSYGGFDFVDYWGRWQSFCIFRVDRHDRLSGDLQNELIEGSKAKIGDF